MHNVLDMVVTSKVAQIDALKQRYPECILTRRAGNRSLHRALKAVRPAFILECKHASPSKGVLRQHFDIDSIVATYNRFASAISVVTDSEFFKGDFAYIAKARANTNLPVLCKDFIISAYQIQLAAHLGADAVLLMLSVLDDDSYRDLLDVARFYGLEVLTEIINDDELDRALALDADIVGINNRDLRTLSIDLETTCRLAPRVPRKCALVSESGIEQREQVCRLARYVDGFLVGSALMQSPDLEQACADLVLGEVESTQARGIPHDAA